MDTLFSSKLNTISLLTQEISQSCGCLKTIIFLQFLKLKRRLVIKQSWHPSAPFLEIFESTPQYSNHPKLILKAGKFMRTKTKNDKYLRNNSQTSLSDVIV